MRYESIEKSLPFTSEVQKPPSGYRRLITLIVIAAAIIGTTILVSRSVLNGPQTNFSKEEKVESISVSAPKRRSLSELPPPKTGN